MYKDLDSNFLGWGAVKITLYLNGGHGMVATAISPASDKPNKKIVSTTTVNWTSRSDKPRPLKQNIKFLGQTTCPI
jgi:hypothetical protein